MHSKGFAAPVVLLAVIIVFTAGFVAYQRVINNRSIADNPLTAFLHNSDSINVWLSGGSDESYTNYYNLNYSLPDTLVGCGAQVNTDITNSTKYDTSRLYVDIKVKTTKRTEPSFEDFCTAMPSPAQGKIDIDKNWLLENSLATIQVNNNVYELTIDHNNRQWYIDSNNRMPLYPDKVAVLSVWPCNENVREELEILASTHNLALADEQYSGLSDIYRRPTKELHIIYDKNAQKFEKDLSLNNYIFSPEESSPSKCRPRLRPPILHQKIDADLSP